MLDRAVNWCSEHGLEFDTVNENLPHIIERFGSDTRKIFANMYIDDRNFWYDDKSPKKILYLCDGGQCETCSNECNHTTDIDHAKNFNKEFGVYVERRIIMLKISNFEVLGWEHAIRGMRNPMNSWEKSDSCTQGYVWCNEFCGHPVSGCDKESGLYLGPNDLSLMKRLRNAGTDHRKFMRMIVVYLDITAPLYWWKEFDTYKVGTVVNSCSTMHKIADKKFMLEDFGHEHLIDYDLYSCDEVDRPVIDGALHVGCGGVQLLNLTINVLNYYRNKYLETKTRNTGGR